MADRRRTRANASQPAEPGPAGPARERILDAATRLFHELGYAGTPVSRIAKEAGMTTANLYWNFPSKKDILGEILRSNYVQVFERLREAVPAGPAPQRLAAYVRAYAGMQLEMLSDTTRFGYAALASSLPLEEQVDLQHHLGRSHQELLREILDQGASESSFQVDDVEVATLAVTSMCEYVYTWYRSGRRLPVDEVLDQYAALALAAVSAGGRAGA